MSEDWKDIPKPETPKKLKIKFYSTVDDQLYQKNADDAGYDVRAAESVYLSHGSRATVRTGLYVAIPPGYYGKLEPRSGLARKHGIKILGGIIDAGYRGEINVIMEMPDENKTESLTFEKGNRIAQLLICKKPDVEFVKVDSIEELGETSRGADGFGSSGVK